MYQDYENNIEYGYSKYKQFEINIINQFLSQTGIVAGQKRGMKYQGKIYYFTEQNWVDSSFVRVERVLENTLSSIALGIVSDQEDDEWITTGETFEAEKKHLDTLEKDISLEIDKIYHSEGYVSKYDVADTEEEREDLQWEKVNSVRQYGKRLKELSDYAYKPYGYRVDVDDLGTCYLGPSEININHVRRVHSYNSEQGRALINYRTTSVDTEDGKKAITLKRQFDISDGKFIGYWNILTSADMADNAGVVDPYLLRVLKLRRKRNELTDIISTIQENQNMIVDEDFKTNIIVQGCAGSGKTMVLLHRLSAISHSNLNIDLEKTYFLTPNHTFISSISGLADELQIGRIKRPTIEEYYLSLLNEYSEDFAIENIKSEAEANPDLVAYFYSDSFITDFNDKYSDFISNREKVWGVLSEIANSQEKSFEKPQYSLPCDFSKAVMGSVDKYNKMVIERTADFERSKHDVELLGSRKKELADGICEEINKLNGINESSANRIKELLPIFDSITEKQAESLVEKSNKSGDFCLEVLDLLHEYQRSLKNNKRAIERQNKQLHEQNDFIQNQFFLLRNRREIKKNESVIRKNYNTISAIEKALKIIHDEINEQTKLNNRCDACKKWLKRYNQDLPEIDLELNKAEKKLENAKGRLMPQTFVDNVKHVMAFARSSEPVNAFFSIYSNIVETYTSKKRLRRYEKNYYKFTVYAALLFAQLYFSKSVGKAELLFIDEGQDISINEYKLLKSLNSPSVIINIFGDTKQSLWNGRGISEWESIIELFSAKEFHLNENYRNSNQITEYCNKIFGMSVAKTGIDGDEVKVFERNMLEEIISKSANLRRKSAIIISRKHNKDTFLQNDRLDSVFLNCIGDKPIIGRIALLYTDEAKGIEFDTVYVYDADMSDNEKYVAYTRAISRLYIFH